MSVVIRGMKMPETCDECPCHHYHSAGRYVCEATPMFYPWNLANTKGIRKEWCPLVELPPHGRLIDGDALFDKMYYADGEPETVSEHINNIVHFMSTLASMPTIIEAEEVSE